MEGYATGLVESLLSPALHGESLDNAELNLVRVLLVSHGEVKVSNEGSDHTQEEEVIGSHEGDHTADGEHEWGEVNLEGIEVTHVGQVEEAEEADDDVDEDDQGEALVLFVFKDEAGKCEEKLNGHDGDCCDGLVCLVNLVEHVEFPSPREHLFTHSTLGNGLWKSAVVFLWNVALIGEWSVGLLTIIILILNFFESKHLFQDQESKDGVDSVDGCEGHEDEVELSDGEGQHGQRHPDLVALYSMEKWGSESIYILCMFFLTNNQNSRHNVGCTEF